MYFDYLVLSVPLSAKSGVSFGVAPSSGYRLFHIFERLDDSGRKL